MVPVPTAAMPARTAPRIWVARPTAPTASAPSRPTISIAARPRIESSANDRITGHASDHTSARMPSTGGRLISAPACPCSSGTASRNSDMVSQHFASPVPNSQAHASAMKIGLWISAIKCGGQMMATGGQAKAAAIFKSTESVDVGDPPRSAIELDPTTVFVLTTLAASALYFFRLGAASLGASEAYSAWAAAMPSPMSIIHIAVPLDPGKQVFYYILLHYFTGVFGVSETTLRMLSPIFAVATLPILFILARTMFDDSIAASAVVLWAFNPVILLLARRARMYPMLAAIALTHFMLLWLVRRKPNWPRTIVCGFFGALAIYTHLAALFLIGAEGAMLLRDYLNRRRNPMPWIALAIALTLFLPYFPIFSP